MRRIKKAAAWILMGALCVVPTGCGNKKSEAQKALAYYQVTQEAVFDYPVQNVIARDNILYCQYEQYTDNADGSMDVTSGIIKFDMNTKESSSIEFENATDSGYIENMHFDENDNIEVVYSEYLLKDLKTGEFFDEKTGMQLTQQSVTVQVPSQQTTQRLTEQKATVQMMTERTQTVQ